MKMSVCGCADTCTEPTASSTRQSPADEGTSGNGTPGTTNWLATAQDNTTAGAIPGPLICCTAQGDIDYALLCGKIT